MRMIADITIPTAVLTEVVQKVKLSTSHCRILFGELCAADTAPGIVEADLQPALTGVSPAH